MIIYNVLSSACGLEHNIFMPLAREDSHKSKSGKTVQVERDEL